MVTWFLQGCQDNSMGEEMVISTDAVLGQLDIYMQTKSNWHIKFTITSSTKMNSKFIQDLNVRSKTKKLLEENIGGKLHEQWLLKYNTKSRATKDKINCTSLKLKTFMFQMTLSGKWKELTR